MLNLIRFCVRCCCKRDLHNLCFADEKGKFDEVVEDKGVRVLIDPKALMHVIGTEMDFVDNRLMYKKSSHILNFRTLVLN